MSKILLFLVATLGVAAVVWWLARPRPVFVIEFRDGECRVRRGKPPPRFLRECRNLALDLPDGEVKAFGGHRTRSLHFSRDIPESDRQRLRNLFGLSGG